MRRGNWRKGIPPVRPWCFVQHVRCVEMPTGMPVSTSADVWWLVTRNKQFRKSLQLLCWQTQEISLLFCLQRGGRKTQVLSFARKSKVQKDHLFQAQGMQTPTSVAPLRMGHFGCRSAHRIFPANYGSSPSRSYAPVLRTADYARVSEAAGLEPMRSVTRKALHPRLQPAASPVHKNHRGVPH